ncbi:MULTISPECIES: Crp/Fnr family transcriptional regulator [Sphingobium]|uniref:Crp/Fnr family transcriptional regulator n=1 Tax=Sphingobium fuliginis (strain ATCC 27551) TaxID=336203 RepID=A0ABQ1EQE8_SPHSA|nr:MULTISPECIES: Crp/Fnr family transcriptional regulator [Sphingobium]RYM00660.1 Crp/Fnr family transcriptional regulator [Sphingobium fuliginis]UXC89246.1 Crp/Fnr family transcriptional regulator [Sphingobium sp. RSMS]WDA38136.1 Crp/Fnr family transcriptional regulator [Sphingobium sp. YC-XJ3]GFZ81762.1 hypothetical protein GCM10019071_08100 [Sphingobium fuliginis]
MKMPSSILLPLLARLGGRTALSKEDGAALLSLPHSLRHCEPGDYIIREGDRPQSCLILLSGFAHRHRISSNGGRHIVGIHGRGDILTLPPVQLFPSEDFVQALTDLRVAAIPLEDVLALMRERANIADALWAEMTAETSVFRAWISNMGRRDARGRIAYLLCELVMRSYPEGGSDGCRLILPLSQVELADATGMTTVHVNRTLKALEKAGVIERDRRRITIPNWRRLTELSDFRPQAWLGRMDRHVELEEEQG